jgi:hypothetical protein
MIADGRKTRHSVPIDTAELQRFNSEHNFETDCEGYKAVIDKLCPYTVGEIVIWGNGTGRITDIRCERLQDISEEDALKEGLECRKNFYGVNYHDLDCDSVPFERWIYSSPAYCTQTHTEPRSAFQDLWQHLYPTGPKSWESNPCVWALTVEKIGEGDVQD